MVSIIHCKILLSLKIYKMYLVIFNKSNSEEMQVKLKQKEDLYKALKEEGDGKVCPLLSRSILFGVAYHNSGKTPSTLFYYNII